MARAADLIRFSLQDLGVLGAGESARGEDMADGLQRLNMMVGGWGLDALTAVRIQGEPFDVLANKHIYSIGPGLDFNTPRPVGQQSIPRASLIQNFGQENQNEIDLHILTYDAYMAIPVKNMRSQLFTHLLYVPGSLSNVPLPLPPGSINIGAGVIILWPVPAVANKIMLYMQKVLPPFADLTTSYPIPDAYLAAIQYNLTVALAPIFQVDPTPETVRQARLSYAAMKRNNYQMADLAIDPMFTMQTPAAGYDINTGSTRRF